MTCPPRKTKTEGGWDSLVTVLIQPKEEIRYPFQV